MNLLRIVNGFGFDCVHVTGEKAVRLYCTITNLLEAAFDSPDYRQIVKCLALLERKNPAGRDEWCVFYNADLEDASGSNAEMLRFFSDGSEAYKVVAQECMDELLEKLDFYPISICRIVSE